MMAGVLAGLLLFGVTGQQFGDLQGGGVRATKPQREYVTYAAEPAVVVAGRRSIVEVHLLVGDGYHVNSHVPKSELLIPTTLKLEPADAPKVGEVEYPKGMTFRFATNPGEALDVYTGAVVLRVPVTAPTGDYVLKGTLRYQACDQKACYPPKALPIAVPFTAK